MENTPRTLATNSLLEQLFAGAIADAEEREQKLSISKLERLALEAPSSIDALKYLAPREAIHVIAEIKRASPSRGKMADIEHPEDLAKVYESNGASAISVLTEQRQFLGHLDDLVAVRAAVAIPVLRKDFISNEYQILEARAAGANIVLLIVAGLNEKVLIRLKRFVEELGMTAFVETHNLDEIKIAVQADTKLIGINARDLSTFETDRGLFASFVDQLPPDVIKVAESAVRNAEDVGAYKAAGADAVLVGEALVTGNAQQLLESFLAI